MSDGDVHTMPVDDLIEHTAAWHCLCGPDAEYFEESGRWHYLHHSLDGRELLESA